MFFLHSFRIDSLAIGVLGSRRDAGSGSNRDTPVCIDFLLPSPAARWGGAAIGTMASPSLRLSGRVAGDGLPWPWEGEAFGIGGRVPCFDHGEEEKKSLLSSLNKIKLYIYI